MPLTFNTLLRDVGLDPADVRLLRHETKRYRGRTPYTLWRKEPAALERYQSTQAIARRAWFRGRYWASFVVTPDGKTLFVGIWAVCGISPVPEGWWHDLNDEPLDTGTDERYELDSVSFLNEYTGKLVIDWGLGTRQWAQLASNQNKLIIELRESFIEPAFPGYASFLKQLSELEALPVGWQQALRAVNGVYLLTCPKTREQYVGSATGSDGFLGRWCIYVEDGHGGNVALRSRDLEDYRVSILQVAGSADDPEAILAMETLWKNKLQSREMGLNRN